MEQHAVPQDITGFKFKLVGEMTLKQFGELAMGLILAYVFYASNWHPFLKWPLTFFFGFFGVALAFFPIEDRPLDVWIVNFLRAIYQPTYYDWKKDSGTTVTSMSDGKSDSSLTSDSQSTLGLWPFKPKEEGKKEAGPPEPVTTLETIQPEEKGKEEKQPIVEVAETKNSGQGVETETPPADLGITTFQSSQGGQKISDSPTLPSQEKETGEGQEKVIGDLQQQPVVTGEKQTPNMGETKPGSLPQPPLSQVNMGQGGTSLTGQGETGEQAQGQAPAPNMTGGTAAEAPSVEELMKFREERLMGVGAGATPARVSFGQQTEEVNMPTEGGGMVTIDRLAQMRKEGAGRKSNEEMGQLAEAERKVAEMTELNKKLLTEMDEIRNKLAGMEPGKDGQAEARLGELTKQKEELMSKMGTLRQEMAQLRVTPIAPPSYRAAPRERKNLGMKVVAKPVQRIATISLTDMPNVVNGLVLDQEGKPLEGVILIIKDKAGNSIRALKTNKIGQFIVSSPLESGSYFLEMEKPGQTFDTFEVTLKGDVLTPIEIRAKGVS